MKLHVLVPIRYASRRTGLPAHIIRTWEARYNAVSPRRSKGKRRLYCDEDILRLRLLSKAVKTGHSISQIAGLTLGELLALPSSDNQDESETGGEELKQFDGADHFLQLSQDQVLKMDAIGLERTLGEAAVHLTRYEFLTGLVEPLNNRIEKMNQQGVLCELNRNIANTAIKLQLWDMLRNVSVSRAAPKFVTAAPMGQYNEVDLLALAMIGLESGWKPVNFGPNLPIKDIATAVNVTQSRALALSLGNGYAKENGTKLEELDGLSHQLSEDIAIVASGTGFMEAGKLLPSSVTFVSNLKDFRHVLESLPYRVRDR